MHFVDIHSHFVYGVDDGADSCATMCAMLDCAYANGVTALVSTPHITPGLVRFPQEKYQEHFAEAQVYCQQRGYLMQLYMGAELLYTPAMDASIQQRRLPVSQLDGSVLVEFSPGISIQEIRRALSLLQDNGYAVVLAHVERYQSLQQGNTLHELKNTYTGLRCQVNAGSILHGHGFFRDLRLWKWLRNRWIDCVASDAHNTGSRPFYTAQAYETIKAKLDTNNADMLFRG